MIHGKPVVGSLKAMRATHAAIMASVAAAKAEAAWKKVEATVWAKVVRAKHRQRLKKKID